MCERPLGGYRVSAVVRDGGEEAKELRADHLVALPEHECGFNEASTLGEPTLRVPVPAGGDCEPRRQRIVRGECPFECRAGVVWRRGQQSRSPRARFLASLCIAPGLGSIQ